jgi:hypothetical protein
MCPGVFLILLNNPPTSSVKFDQTSSLIQLACCIVIHGNAIRPSDRHLGSSSNQADPVSNIVVEMFKTMDAVHITMKDSDLISDIPEHANNVVNFFKPRATGDLKQTSAPVLRDYEVAFKLSSSLRTNILST